MQQNKTEYQAELLANRLSKRYKHLKKWAKRTGVFCFRLYDRDIPEIPLAIDLYEEEPYPDGSGSRFFARVALYERPYEKQEAEEEAWLDAMETSVATVLGIPKEAIITKVRKRQSGDSQYEKDSGKTLSFITREQGLRFKVNLSDYIDTGLFFDHRPLRLKVREESAGKHILNLYCYTGAFSVYAAAGDALHIDSVDLSGRYLSWAEENMHLNGFTDKKKYRFIESDVKTFLEKAAPAAEKRDAPGKASGNNNTGYDLIILDPPTFSNSKKTDTLLDINRDWPSLIVACAALLAPNGVLYFSTNSRKLAFDEKKLPEGLLSEDISSSTIPEDFRNERIHRVWKIRKPATRRCELVHGYFPEHP
ncbi:MAG: class I SAM-dependent methyltransferase [Spirochaetaceae bacterium]|nr:class I SAM-dependent methyltransferase [Spirochaetaceae bacterium]